MKKFKNRFLEKLKIRMEQLEYKSFQNLIVCKKKIVQAMKQKTSMNRSTAKCYSFVKVICCIVLVCIISEKFGNLYVSIYCFEIWRFLIE
jgi:hypothetical protein